MPLNLTHIAAPIQRRFKRVPARLRQYLWAFLALALAVAIAEILLHTLGSRASLAYALLYFVLIMGAAWLGYGPGLMVCAITTFALPPLLLGRAPRADPGRFGLLVVICLLVSRLAASKRRTEASLRYAAEQLESRVRERTLELERNGQSLREQTRLLDLAHDAILTTDSQGVICFWNQGAQRMYEWSVEEAMGRDWQELLQVTLPQPYPAIEAQLLAEGFWQGEVTHARRSGSRLLVMSRWALRRGADGKPCGRLEINTDVTERRRVEDQLRHTQKLESVGRLAGGVAHDFNNLLTVINGYTEMLMADMPRDDAMREILVEIRAAGERAAGLTRQLLAFSRKQLVQPTVLSINEVVTDVEKMLRRLIGEDIAIVIRLAPSAGAIKADAGQIQQILMNLAVNARDAMPAGGTLILETAYVKFDESYRADHPEVEPGDYVLLAVTDTGTGMTPEVQQRLFEPFFTTKPQGVGTGLGLATVYGMVKQSGGWIWVYSEVGNGTVFKIYFPRTGEPLSVAPKPRENELRGSETILVVEDQREVRTLAVAALTRYGYRVMDAGSGDEALALSNEFAGRIDMLLTDVIMPGMTGPQLAEKLTQLRPEMVVLFISGYTEGAFSYRDLLASTVAYLQKPFTPGSLAEKVRKVLGPAKALGAAAAQGGDASPGGQSGGQPD